MDRAALIALPVYWVALFVATHYPRVRIPGEIPHSDKLIHFAAFGLLALLYWRFMKARKRTVGWVGAAILVAYAGLDEYLQQFFGRYTDVMDFVANTVGVVTVLGVIALLSRVMPRSDRAPSR